MADRPTSSRTLVLSVSLAGVEKHTQRIFAKLGLLPEDAQHRRVLAVVRFLQAG